MFISVLRVPQLHYVRRLPVWLSAAVLMLWMATPTIASESQSIRATPWIGPAGISRTTGQIMSLESQENRESGDISRWALQPRAHDRRAIPFNFDAPPASEYIQEPSPPMNAATQTLSAPLNVQPIGVSFMAIDYWEASLPLPSLSGAVGPNHILLAVNGRIRSFDKNGTLQALDTGLGTFFAPISDSANVGNPRVRYDRDSGRWIVAALNYYAGVQAVPNRVLLAVSDNAELTGSTVWTFFYFRQDQVAPAGDAARMLDELSMGIDVNAVYLAANCYSALGGEPSLAGATAFVVRKSSLMQGGPIVVSAFRNLTDTPPGIGPQTPQAVDNYDPQASHGYIVAINNLSFGSLVLRRISDPGGTPSISDNIFLNVLATYQPADVPHKENNAGPNGYLDAVDDRLSASHVRDGRLWTAHSIGVDSSGRAASFPSRTAVRWYELADLDTQPGVVRSATIFDSSSSNPLFYWIPSLISSSTGRVMFSMNVAGNASYVDAANTFLEAGTSTPAPLRYTNTTHAYNPWYDLGGSNGRMWGTCSEVALDPANEITFWSFQQFVAGPGYWGVQVTQFLSPDPVLDPGQYTVCLGATNVSFDLLGSNFYDPGPGSNRPSVEISGSDVTVNDLVLIDSHTFRVTVSVTPNGAPGDYHITLTSPDGRTATLYNGLAVRGGRADFNGDCRVDEEDFLLLAGCATGPGVVYDPLTLPPQCDLPITISGHLPADLDDDWDVDVDDFAVLQRCFSGSEFMSDRIECIWGVD